MLARIFRPAKNAMQSGKANTREWVLAFAPGAPRLPDPLMGWTQTDRHRGSGPTDVRQPRRGRLLLPERYGIVFEECFPRAGKKRIVKAYADNFAFGRKIPWTH